MNDLMDRIFEAMYDKDPTYLGNLFEQYGYGVPAPQKQNAETRKEMFDRKFKSLRLMDLDNDEAEKVMEYAMGKMHPVKRDDCFKYNSHYEILLKGYSELKENHLDQLFEVGLGLINEKDGVAEPLLAEFIKASPIEAIELLKNTIGEINKPLFTSVMLGELANEYLRINEKPDFVDFFISKLKDGNFSLALAEGLTRSRKTVQVPEFADAKKTAKKVIKRFYENRAISEVTKVSKIRLITEILLSKE